MSILGVETLWERYSQHPLGGVMAALVDLLLRAGAYTTLKDKEGHFVADFDFQLDADSELLEKAEEARCSSKNELSFGE